jgi:hypothetical protein
MAVRPQHLAAHTFLVLALLVAASALFDEEQDGVLALIGNDLATTVKSAHRAPANNATATSDDEYVKIPGLLYAPKKSDDHKTPTEGECRQICNARGQQCQGFSFNANKQECKTSPSHMGYDPDFITAQKNLKGWDVIPGFTSFQSGFLKMQAKDQDECQHLCKEAAACNAICFRRRDGLCLLTGRTIEILPDWNYYEREGVAEYAKGFVLPVQKSAPHEVMEAEKAEVLRLEKSVDEEKVILTKAKAEAEVVKSAANITSHQEEILALKDKALEGEIDGVRKKRQAEQEVDARALAVDLQATSIDRQRTMAMNRAEDEERFLKKQHNQTLLDSQKMAALKVANAQAKSQDMMTEAMTKAGMSLLHSQIASAKHIETKAEKVAQEWGSRVEDSKENNAKKAVIEAKALKERAAELKKTVLVREKAAKRELTRKEARITQDEVQMRNRERRTLTLQSEARLRTAQEEAQAGGRRLKGTERLQAAADTSRAHIIQMLNQRIDAGAEKLDKLRTELDMIYAVNEANNRSAVLAANAKAAITKANIENAEKEEQIEAERRAVALKAKQSEEREMLRFKDHEANEKQLAKKQDDQLKIAKQLRAETDAVKDIAQGAKAKLFKDLNTDSELPPAQAATALVKAKAAYAQTVGQANKAATDMAKEASRPRLITILPSAVKGVQFESVRQSTPLSPVAIAAMPPQQRNSVLNRMSPGARATTVGLMLSPDQATTLASMSKQVRSSTLAAMTPEARSGALEQMSEDAREEALQQMSPPNRELAQNVLAVVSTSIPSARTQTLMSFSDSMQTAVLQAMSGVAREGAEEALRLAKMSGVERKVVLDAMSGLQKTIALKSLPLAQKAAYEKPAE